MDKKKKTTDGICRFLSRLGYQDTNFINKREFTYEKICPLGVDALCKFVGYDLDSPVPAEEKPDLSFLQSSDDEVPTIGRTLSLEDSPVGVGRTLSSEDSPVGAGRTMSSEEERVTYTHPLFPGLSVDLPRSEANKRLSNAELAAELTRGFVPYPDGEYRKPNSSAQTSFGLDKPALFAQMVARHREEARVAASLADE